MSIKDMTEQERKQELLEEAGKKPTTIELAPDECAIVFTADGSPEMYMPKSDDEEGQVADNVIICASLCTALGSGDKRIQEIINNFVAQMEEMK